MKTIQRTTKVVSVSLPGGVTKQLESACKTRGQSRSAFIAMLIQKEAEDERWRGVYAKGLETARTFNITSEEDIDRILHGD
jgi:metal-responsive CopG/Arc/MetJ family transcriptional regulator